MSNRKRSMARAARRGKMILGNYFSKRPFSNAKATEGRMINEHKKKMYHALEEYRKRASEE